MIQHAYYLLVLLISLGGLVFLDHRFKLALFYNLRQTLLTIIPTLLFFIAWDLMGIVYHVFLYGHARYSLGVMLAPEFPIEELFFLTVFIYSSLLIYRLVSHVYVSHH